MVYSIYNPPDIGNPFWESSTSSPITFSHTTADPKYSYLGHFLRNITFNINCPPPLPLFRSKIIWSHLVGQSSRSPLPNAHTWGQAPPAPASFTPPADEPRKAAHSHAKLFIRVSNYGIKGPVQYLPLHYTKCLARRGPPKARASGKACSPVLVPGRCY